MPTFHRERLAIGYDMLKVFASPTLFPGKLGCGSPGVPFSGPIAENDVSLLAAALRIQVCVTQLLGNF